MTQPTVTKRINIGYDAMVSADDLQDDIHDYHTDLADWFSNNNTESNIQLHHEPSHEYQCTLYYLSVEVPMTLEQCFDTYFA